MSARPISTQVLADKITAAILEALRCGVHIDVVQAALSQAQVEVGIAAPMLQAAGESGRGP